MTRIDFYHYAEDKLRFACRLAAKVFASGRAGSWSTRPTRRSSRRSTACSGRSSRRGFVPHCRADGRRSPPRRRWSSRRASEALPHHDVLLNLGDEWPPFFASLRARCSRSSGTDEEDKQRARGRFVFYRKRGYEINVNAISEA